jgi:hypothetical protein
VKSEERKRRQATAQRAKARRQRQEALALLGGRCARCGFDDWRALQIDHVEGGGRTDRSTFANTAAFTQHVITACKLGDRGKYQVLCANCNWIKRHEREEFGF